MFLLPSFVVLLLQFYHFWEGGGGVSDKNIFIPLKIVVTDLLIYGFR